MGTPASRRAPSRALIATTLATALLLTACGGDQDPTAAPASEDQAATPDAGATTAPPDDGGAPDANLTDGCVEDAVDGTDHFPEKVSFDEAQGVSVTYEDTYKVVEVSVPYSEEGSPPFTAVLVQCGTPAPDLTGDLADAQVIEVPVQDVVTMTTVNLPHLAGLDALDTLAGVGTAAFVTTEEVVAEIASREIPDFADANGVPDRERLIAAAPDLLVVDAFGATLLDDVRGYADAGVPTVINADFNESTPLGRAEWLKFTSLFLNREGAATRLYEEIATGYRETAALTEDAGERPTVLLDQPFEGTWYVPAGGSFVAQMVADAGGEYVFADEGGTGALSLDIETVLADGGDADVWIGAGSVNGTLADLAAVDERFTEFAAYQEGAVWAADAGANEAGGNPIFERAVMRPDLVVADLTSILHPEVLAGHEPVFYGPVPEAG